MVATRSVLMESRFEVELPVIMPVRLNSEVMSGSEPRILYSWSAITKLNFFSRSKVSSTSEETDWLMEGRNLTSPCGVLKQPLKSTMRIERCWLTPEKSLRWYILLECALAKLAGSRSFTFLLRNWSLEMLPRKSL